MNKKPVVKRDEPLKDEKFFFFNDKRILAITSKQSIVSWCKTHKIKTTKKACKVPCAFEGTRLMDVRILTERMIRKIVSNIENAINTQDFRYDPGQLVKARAILALFEDFDKRGDSER